MIRLFVGYDPREACAYHVFCQSVLEFATVPVEFIPLHTPMLRDFDGQRDGSNAFIFSRYLVPSLCNYGGWAVFMDGDMLMRADIAELWNLSDPSKAVQVVKHDYQTLHPVKYRLSPLESPNVDYPRKNWSSVVLWNCAHPANRVLSREFVQDAGGAYLHRFMWLEDHQIGTLPETWNALVGEPRQWRMDPPKVAHFTLGVPGFKFYRDDECGREWEETLLRTVRLLGEHPVDLMRRAMEDSSG